MIDVEFHGIRGKEHENAIRYCAKLTEEVWKPKVPLKVQVTFVNGSNYLAFATPSSFEVGRSYSMPIAMARQIQPDKYSEHSSNDVNIWIRMNRKWHLDTTKKIDSDSYDMTSACLHEMFHGLMFSANGFEMLNKNQTSAKILGKPGYFTSFLAVETVGNGDCALRSYLNSPKLLAKAITGNLVWFKANDKRIARIYAPRRYAAGSLHHIDPSSRQRFMQPRVRKGEQLHDIGPLTVRMKDAIMEFQNTPSL